MESGKREMVGVLAATANEEQDARMSSRLEERNEEVQHKQV